MGVMLEAIAVLAELQNYGISYQFAGGDEVKVLCPFHNDSSASCHVNSQNRLFKCQTAGCEVSGDIITLLAGHVKKSRAVVIDELSKRYDLEDEKVIDPTVIERWHEAIWKADALRNELYRRGVTDVMIRKRRFGENDGRITIPITNKSGAFVNVRKYLPGAPGAQKMRNTRGYGKIRWFPVDQLKFDKILLCGGECKALVAADQLNPLGIGCITATCGEENLPPELMVDLKGKRVYVCMDVDAAGEKSAIKHATAIRMLADFVAIINLPLDKDKHPKGDINDFITTEQGQLYPLIEAANEFIPEYVERLAVDESEPVELHLNEAIHADNSNKRLTVKGIVAALDTTPYILPKDVVIKCSKDQPYCAVCPVFIKGRSEFTIPKESPSILELIDSPSTHHLEVIKTTVGIPKVCRICEYEKLSDYNVEAAQISPQLEISNRFGDRQPIPAYCIGDGLEANENYEFTGKLVASPKTQQANLLISSYKTSQDALSTYSVERAEDLSIFWPKSWSVEDIEDKLKDIYDDLSANVTSIRGREPLHTAIDLAYHSPLNIRFDGQQEKGWIDLLILGDSSNGKSQTAEALSKHYGLGKIFECSNSTAAGLLGGMQKLSDRWYISWGVIPTNDGRLVILEEVKEAPEEAISKLRDMRSRGIAQTVKIGRSYQTHARTRQIWISNPRSDCKMSAYPFGILAIKELIGALQDVRRFDLAIITTESDVEASCLNSSKGDRSTVEHKFTSELCRQLILWAWTRREDQVRFTDDAERLILSEASRLCDMFTDAIPIVDRGSMRFKLARVAAAMASRLFSCSEDFETLEVHHTIVQAASNYLVKIYSQPTFGYIGFSKAQQLLTTLLDPDMLVAAIKNTPYPKDFCRSMLAQDYVELQDLADWGNFDNGAAQGMVSLFVRKHALIRKGKYYRKSSKLIELLKELEADQQVEDKPRPTNERQF